MSIKLMTAVWDTKIGPANRRLVLLALADIANDEGEAWPSIDTLAVRANCSRTSAEDSLRSLVTDGIIERESRGFHRSNMYRINRAALTPENRGPLKTPGSQGDDPRKPGRETPENPGTEPSVEPPVEPLKPKPSSEANASTDSASPRTGHDQDREASTSKPRSPTPRSTNGVGGQHHAGVETPHSAESIMDGALFATEDPPKVARQPRRQARTPAPEEFPLTTKLREWFHEKGLPGQGVVIEFETEQWLEYHRAKGTLNASWDAAWRQWMTKAGQIAQERATRGNNHRRSIDRPSDRDRGAKRWVPKDESGYDESNWARVVAAASRQ